MSHPLIESCHAGSAGSALEEYPEETNVQIRALAFGCGPSAALLFVGLEDDSVCVIDTAGVHTCVCGHASVYVYICMYVYVCIYICVYVQCGSSFRRKKKK